MADDKQIQGVVDPGANAARKEIDKQVEQTRSQVPSSSQEAEAAINAQRKTLKEYAKGDAEYKTFLNVAEKDYKDRIQKADDNEFKEKMVHALGQFTAGLSGLASLQNKQSMGLSTGGIKFTPSDFKSKRDQIYRDYKEQRQQAQQELQQRLGAASADLGAAERQADRLHRDEQATAQRGFQQQQLAETRRGRKASEDASRMQRMTSIRQFGETLDLRKKELDLREKQLGQQKADKATISQLKQEKDNQLRRDQAYKRLSDLAVADKIAVDEAKPIIKKDLKILGLSDQQIADWEEKNTDVWGRDESADNLAELVADGLNRVQVQEPGAPTPTADEYITAISPTGKEVKIHKNNTQAAKARGLKVTDRPWTGE